MPLDLSATATSLMNSLGDKTYITIARKSGGVFDPVAGTITGDTITQLAASGVVTKVDSKLVDGTRIKSTDKMVILDNAVTPVYTDLLTFNDVSHAIVQINEVNHAGVVQLFKVVCRG